MSDINENSEIIQPNTTFKSLEIVKNCEDSILDLEASVSSVREPETYQDYLNQATLSKFGELEDERCDKLHSYFKFVDKNKKNINLDSTVARRNKLRGSYFSTDNYARSLDATYLPLVPEPKKASETSLKQKTVIKKNSSRRKATPYLYKPAFLPLEINRFDIPILVEPERKLKKNIEPNYKLSNEYINLYALKKGRF